MIQQTFVSRVLMRTCPSIDAAKGTLVYRLGDAGEVRLVGSDPVPTDDPAGCQWFEIVDQEPGCTWITPVATPLEYLPTVVLVEPPRFV